MLAKSRHSVSAFTLVETVVAMLVSGIVVLGAASYRYTAVLDVKKSQVKSASTRAALFVIEAWRGLSTAPATFNPLTLSTTAMPIETATGPAVPDASFTALGSYKININGFNCFATLCWKDIDQYNDVFYGKTRRVRAFCVVLDFPERGQDITADSDADRSITMTSYRYY
jgi:type II secretory pathway pseudopilin PulG